MLGKTEGLDKDAQQEGGTGTAAQPGLNGALPTLPPALTFSRASQGYKFGLDFPVLVFFFFFFFCVFPSLHCLLWQGRVLAAHL